MKPSQRNNSLYFCDERREENKYLHKLAAVTAGPYPETQSKGKPLLVNKKATPYLKLIVIALLSAHHHDQWTR